MKSNCPRLSSRPPFRAVISLQPRKRILKLPRLEIGRVRRCKDIHFAHSVDQASLNLQCAFSVFIMKVCQEMIWFCCPFWIGTGAHEFECVNRRHTYVNTESSVSLDSWVSWGSSNMYFYLFWVVACRWQWWIRWRPPWPLVATWQRWRSRFI